MALNGAVDALAELLCLVIHLVLDLVKLLLMTVQLFGQCLLLLRHERIVLSQCRGRASLSR